MRCYPCPARRQCPPNIPAASAATYPLRCFAPQWARFDNRHSISAPAPTLAVVSGSGARGTSSPLNRQCYPPHFMRECIPPNLHDPQRAKGSLDRRSKWFSLVPFFLQKKERYSCRGTNLPIPRPQAQHLFTATRAFPHVTGVFLIVVVPPTVPAQLSAAAACYYGKNYSFCRVAG